MKIRTGSLIVAVLAAGACSQPSSTPVSADAGDAAPAADVTLGYSHMERQNEALALRFYEEIFNRGNMAALDELVAENVVDHNLPPGMPPGRAGAAILFGSFRQAFPDLKVTVQDVIVPGEKVTAHGTMEGTHQGTFMGFPATGRRFTITWIDVMHVRDGQVVDVWHQEDFLSMLVQLGAVTLPAPSGA